MSEVCHFELIYKLQSPSGPADTVLQGHFLEISNLEANDLSFRLSYVTGSTSDPDRSLFENTFAIVDTPAVDNNFGFSLSGSLTSSSFVMSPLVRIPAGATALVALLPSDAFPPPGVPAPAPDFEARGFVRLTLPALFQIQQGPFGPIFNFVPQADDPVRVMLTPQNRATYFDAAGDITDQTQASLPLASGAAVTTIPPGQGPFALPEQFADLPLVASELASSGLEAESLAGMLALAGAAEMDLDAFNGALRASGVDLAIERRPIEAPKKAGRKAKGG